MRSQSFVELTDVSFLLYFVVAVTVFFFDFVVVASSYVVRSQSIVELTDVTVFPPFILSLLFPLLYSSFIVIIASSYVVRSQSFVELMLLPSSVFCCCCC